MDIINIMADSSVRLMVPLLIATLGELISQRAGIMNVGLEGMMTIGAFAGALAAAMGAPLLVAVFFAILCGAAGGAMMAGGAVFARGNQILVGFALFLFLPGLSNFLLVQLNVQGMAWSMPEITIPLLSQIPVFGSALFSQNVFFYASVLLAVGVWLMFRYTMFGLLITSVGHDAHKTLTKGVSTRLIQLAALLICGGLAGLAGASLSLGSVGAYTPSIIGGRGFIVIAIVILGRWTVGGAIAGALLMGFLEALKLNAPRFSEIPVQLLGALPWLVVILMLVMSAKMRSSAPRSLAQQL